MKNYNYTDDNRIFIFYGKLFPEKGAVCDAFAKGHFFEDGELVECTVGFNEDIDHYYVDKIFIPEQITKDGTYYYATTIDAETTYKFDFHAYVLK